MNRVKKVLAVLPVMAFGVAMLTACNHNPVHSSGYKHDPSSQVKAPRIMVNPTLVNPNIPVP